MIQDYQSLKYSVTNFSSYGVGQIQKIFSTCRYLAFSIRFPGETKWLYLGRGSGFEGIWNGHKPPESALRVREKLCDYLRHQMSSALFLKVDLDEKDRIIRIDYQKWGKKCSFYYFYKGREAFFLNDFCEEEERKLYSSWNSYLPLELRENDNFHFFDQVGRMDVLKRKDARELSPILDLLESEKKSRTVNVKKKKKKLERKVQNIENDYKKVKAFSGIGKVLDKWKVKLACDEPVPELMPRKINLAGMKFRFKEEASLFQKLETLYNKRKSLKPILDFLEKRLDKAQADLALSSDIEIERKNVIMPTWKISKEKVKKETIGEFKVFSEPNFSVAIGRSAQENDDLRSRWAKKNDWWFHLENMPSAHAYVKLKNSSSPTLGEIKKIAHFLKEQSNYSSTEVPLIYAQVKNIKGAKGKPGSVFFKKEKRVSIFF